MKLSEVPFDLSPHRDNLFNEIRSAITPWRPSHIQTYLDYDIDEDMNRLLVEMRFGPQPTWIFYYRMPFPRSLEVDQDILEWVFINSLRDDWRTRPLVRDLPPTIYLGEN